jgi:hypothetical protein
MTESTGGPGLGGSEQIGSCGYFSQRAHDRDEFSFREPLRKTVRVGGQIARHERPEALSAGQVVGRVEIGEQLTCDALFRRRREGIAGRGVAPGSVSVWEDGRARREGFASPRVIWSGANARSASIRNQPVCRSASRVAASANCSVAWRGPLSSSIVNVMSQRRLRLFADMPVREAAQLCWEKALALDPTSAPLNAMLGFIHCLDARFDREPDRQWPLGGSILST